MAQDCQGHRLFATSWRLCRTSSPVARPVVGAHRVLPTPRRGTRPSRMPAVGRPPTDGCSPQRRCSRNPESGFEVSERTIMLAQSIGYRRLRREAL